MHLVFMMTIILFLVMIPSTESNDKLGDHGYTLVSEHLPISCCKSEADQKGNVLVGTSTAHVIPNIQAYEMPNCLP